MSGDLDNFPHGYCSVAEACRIAGVSRGYMCAMIRAGKIAGQKVGNSYAVLCDSLNNFSRQPGMGRPTESGSSLEILTSPTAARIAGLDRVHFARLIREGKGPRHQTVEAGGSHIVLIIRRDLDAWVEERRAEVLPGGCVVYAISDGNCHFKIGKAVNIHKRMKQLQTGNGRRLSLVAYLECDSEHVAYRAETAAKRSIADRRSVGEWFECDALTALQALYEGAFATGIEYDQLHYFPGDSLEGELNGR